ncbi:MAG: CvpA family protein [Candidatus Eisenbacteria bacterium]|uniref:CvpA family protein n=1 Tax=Eiseniibacteriota bacterium TaxID=2212470 RepID=A0A9D6QPC0_UNCEI|nr:CvpA family protein [Candidatus Eisenbacteria bacterium]MBI3539784.1 CvpA family protein [Candidatus Eisenbacteria bacterium]
MVVLVLLFAIGGFLRGTVAQVFVVVGVVAGWWLAGFVSHWVGDHWRGARPAAVFWTLRWVVAALAGLAVAALFQWWGERLGKSVREGPLGWLDRGGGLVVGAVVGAVVCAFLMLAALTLDRPGRPGEDVARMRLGPATMSTAAMACGCGARYVPGSSWLQQRFLAARQRAGRLRAHGTTTHHS